jgi:hypothetical protein
MIAEALAEVLPEGHHLGVAQGIEALQALHTGFVGRIASAMASLTLTGSPLRGYAPARTSVARVQVVQVAGSRPVLPSLEECKDFAGLRQGGYSNSSTLGTMSSTLWDDYVDVLLARCPSGVASLLRASVGDRPLGKPTAGVVAA